MDLEELKAKLVGYYVSDDKSDNWPNLDINDNAVHKIQDTLKCIKQKSHISKNEASKDLGDTSLKHKHKYNPDEVRRTNQVLQKEFQNKKSETYQKMLEERQRLPAWETREMIIAAVARHKAIIVSGMTGCGKTTQVPQFILDDALQRDDFNANIICTQPRRISATSIAERVASERDDTLGRLVGYQIRLDGDVSQFTRLLFCTTGIVLRRLEGDPDLEGVTHIIIDEVHERSELSDFLILVIKKLLVRRPELRVILMSATINAGLFSEYFDKCPVINIPGRLFSVQQLFLEDVIEITNLSLSFNQLLTDGEDEDDVQYCPAGFSAVGDQCFIKKERNNRDKARIACRDIGASLPELHTWDQQSNLEKFLTDQSISGPAWLNGEVGYTHHRENSVKFFWPTRYFPSSILKCISILNIYFEVEVGGECLVKYSTKADVIDRTKLECHNLEIALPVFKYQQSYCLERVVMIKLYFVIQDKAYNLNQSKNVKGDLANSLRMPFDKAQADLKGEKVVTVQSAKAFIEVLRSFRGTSKSVLSKIMTSSNKLHCNPQLIDMTAAQTEAAREAILELINFQDEYAVDYQQRLC
ncbi:ATPdependent RNA helicase [Bulinus truncatus]|nr:ATPdependent RNA helicase [Bulinus truncatus]